MDAPWPQTSAFDRASREYWEAALAWFVAEVELAGGNQVAVTLAENGWHGTAEELLMAADAITSTTA